MPNVLIRAFDCVNYRLDGVIKQFQAVQEGIGQFRIMPAVEEEDEYLEQKIEELFPDEKTGKLKWFWNNIYEVQLINVNRKMKNIFS